MSTAATTHELAVATDTQLAELHSQAAALTQKRASIVATIHSAAGDRKQNTWQVRYALAPWGMSLDQAIAATPTTSWDARDHAKAVADLAAVDAKLTTNATEIAAVNQVWIDNGCWSRFFLVPGGHLHSSTTCSTCNNGHEPTMFGWLPNLSGLTEADAVAAHGALLCTVCFPSAPTEWTNHYELEAEAKKAARCTGSGEYVEVKNWQARYARCPVCNTSQARTTTGKLRAHKPPKKD